ncbi:protein-glutamine gamma-glutamyltransferase 2 [Chanos chanos]|uniref:Protein-glutamine gamma-glutamyltransferase 2 n=1 Tax=Chanos chanos TaxID=29144 RepID=A0A6J2VSQ6_CHACN|nr:protein-glutamine gamma-glutamyltransferase 2-like [Chanos chanos]
MVQLHCVKNNTAHHTNDIAVDRLIVRRGQPFHLTFHMGRPFVSGHDFLELTVETGPDPSEALGTKTVFRCEKHSGVRDKKSWRMEVSETDATTVTMSIVCSADASIGLYTLSVKTVSLESETARLGNLLVLFNPWCEGDALCHLHLLNVILLKLYLLANCLSLAVTMRAEDWVFLPDEEERQEYVMREQGILYKGTGNYITPMAWDFGQFEDDVIDICLTLLDMNPKCLKNASEDFSARCNPIYVSRVVSAMINSNDDHGVLMGRWSEPYFGGVSPAHWNGSVQILRKWMKYDCHPVKYGQCWVFAAVMCTVLRCLGIPCRVVSNYESAHDTDKSLTVDEYFSDYGVRPKQTQDSVWNYHVWVEAWMKRPDLSSTSIYDGWQVLDPTPQEKSSGVYCCGPAPVKAVLEGHTDVKYDVPFVYAEVNADRITWLVMANGSKKCILSDTTSVGQNISTKAVGKDARVDITANYKQNEGSGKEREIYKEAVKRNLNNNKDSDSTLKPPNMSMKIEEVGKPISGMDIALTVTLHSDHPTAQNLSVHINAQAMRYTGIPAADICSLFKEIQLQPNEDQSIPITIPYSSYGPKMLTNNSIKVTVIATDKEDPKETFLAQKDIVPQSPTLKITTSGIPMQYSQMSVEVALENPLPVALKDCTLSVTGSGLLRHTREFRFPEVGAGQTTRTVISFWPYRPGPKTLVANFDCQTFRDIKASCNVDIRASISYCGILY